MELGNFLLKLAVTYVFFDEIDISYQIWNNMYLGNYTKDGVDKDRKIIVPTIEKILKLLIDKKSKAKVLVTSESTIQAFKAFKEKSK